MVVCFMVCSDFVGGVVCWVGWIMLVVLFVDVLFCKVNVNLKKFGYCWVFLCVCVGG